MERLDVNTPFSERVCVHTVCTCEQLVMLWLRTSLLWPLAYSPHTHSSHNSSWWSLVTSCSTSAVSCGSTQALHVDTPCGQCASWVRPFCALPHALCPRGCPVRATLVPPCPAAPGCFGQCGALAGNERERRDEWGQAVYSPGSLPVGSIRMTVSLKGRTQVLSDLFLGFFPSRSDILHSLVLAGIGATSIAQLLPRGMAPSSRSPAACPHLSIVLLPCWSPPLSWLGEDTCSSPTPAEALLQAAFSVCWFAHYKSAPLTLQQRRAVFRLLGWTQLYWVALREGVIFTGLKWGVLFGCPAPVPS